MIPLRQRHSTKSLLLATAFLRLAGAADEPLSEDDWLIKGGNWTLTRELQAVIRQRSDTTPAMAVSCQLTPAHGVWRCWVEPGVGIHESGFVLLATPGLNRGLRCVLDGRSGTMGFALKRMNGDTLWEDKWAPWQLYEPHVLEAVVEPGRIRAQLFNWDAKTLVSQSPWIDLPENDTDQQGSFGLFTDRGPARFWRWEIAEQPLSPITPDAPNKRRLVQGDDSPWVLTGSGNWMWTSKDKRWLRQYAHAERAWAVNRELRGALTTWRARVKVSPGAGGAGFVFQADEDAENGFICWLGGRPGNGTLMLYCLTKCLWSSPPAKWRYDTDYVLVAQTQEGRVQVCQYAADGTTVIAKSPWLKAPEEMTKRVGCFGFHTWKGRAQFADFGIGEATPMPAGKTVPAVSTLGPDWITEGRGKWTWIDKAKTRIRQSASTDLTSALHLSTSGALGTWQCRIRIPKGTNAAGLIFQAARDSSTGFVCVLNKAPGQSPLQLRDLSGRCLWEDPEGKWQYETEYILQGRVVVDRVGLRMLTADRKSVLAESVDVYVSDTNNDRRGSIGFMTEDGPAEFWDWDLDE